MASIQKTTPELERVDWDTFTEVMPWKQGEHVAIIGMSGDGKSVLLRALSWQRDWVAWLSTKKKDEEYDRNLAMGYKRINRWPPDKPPKGQQYQRLMVWPPFKNLMDIYNASAFYKKILEFVYKDESWTVCLDDLYFLSEELKLRNQIKALQYQIRSIRVTSLSAMQRPSSIPLESYNQSPHIFLRPQSDYADVLRVRGLVGVSNTKMMYEYFEQIEEHEWMYVNRRRKFPLCIVKPPLERTK